MLKFEITRHIWTQRSLTCMSLYYRLWHLLLRNWGGRLCSLGNNVVLELVWLADLRRNFTLGCSLLLNHYKRLLWLFDARWRLLSLAARHRLFVLQRSFLFYLLSLRLAWTLHFIRILEIVLRLLSHRSYRWTTILGYSLVKTVCWSCLLLRHWRCQVRLIRWWINTWSLNTTLQIRFLH